jgi:hypothetical protein
MRPANMVTSVADVLAGIAISGFFALSLFHSDYLYPVILLCISTACLYAGGIVFNDVFDFELDCVERPERPIPKGIVNIAQASIAGAILLFAGIILASFVHMESGILALAISIAALTYDKWGKHHPFLGPVNMGLCRGLNLLLGISILPDMLGRMWLIAIVPIIYIASITMISRGEVHGSSKRPLYTAAAFYAVVLIFIMWFAYLSGTIWNALPFLLLFGWMIYNPLLKAIDNPVGSNIGKAVKGGVIALIAMNAAWVAASGSIYIALMVILLLPLSIWLSRIFAVT